MMKTLSFSLPVATRDAHSLTTAWLMLGLTALLLAGVFSMLLVLSRTPGVQTLFPLADFFKVALIIHVNLSVLVWFLAFAAVFWSITSVKRATYWDYAALLSAACGMLLMVLTPFTGEGEPLMNNYVPILNHAWFFNGLLLFVAGIMGVVVRALFTNTPPLRPRTGPELLRFAVYIAAVSALTALAAFIASYLGTPDALTSELYHEILFWGAGHVMQFTHTQLMLVSWVILAVAIGVNIRLTSGWGMLLFILVLAPLLLVPVIYLSYQSFFPQHITAFTSLMRLGGLGSIPLGAVILYCLLRDRKRSVQNPHLKAALYWSIGLFASGGIVGFLINGSNVIIPSHYHGCTVGVTLAFMGLTYYLLPQLGYAKPNQKWARVQAWCYGGGQFIHILGLAWSGGYGVQRKAAGAAQSLERLPEVFGMGMMGLGGLLSIVGGLLFLLIAFKAIWQQPTAVTTAGEQVMSIHSDAVKQNP
jgi:hypothetical protein